MHLDMVVYIIVYIYISQQGDIYDTVMFRFLQILTKS